MICMFGVKWVMPRMVVELLWCLWRERMYTHLRDVETPVMRLKFLFLRALYDWMVATTFSFSIVGFLQFSEFRF